MLLAALIGLKTLLFISITNIHYNRITVFLFTLLISLFILSVVELADNKYKKPLQIIFYTLFSAIMFVDVLHYSYFQSLPSLALLGQVGQLGAVGDSIKKLLTLKNILFLVDLPFAIFFIIKMPFNFSKSIIKSTLIISAVAIILITSLTVSSDKLSVLTNQEFYSYHTADIMDRYFTEDIDENIRAKEVLEIMENNESVEKENLKHYGIGKDRNLIVVQVEALQNFVINLNYKGQEITPNFNEFIKDNSSLYFDEYFQLIGRGNTSDAEFITNNSLHPSSEEPTYSQYALNTFYGLPWILRDKGYNVWAFHGFEKEFWNRREAYPNQGYQRFVSEEDFDYEEKIIFGISDREFYDQTLEYLKELDEIDENPFYSFIVTLSSHTPFNIEDEYRELEIEEPQKDTMVGDYLQAIHYADKEFGNFIEGLKQKDLYENSVIAVYGDHYAINNSEEEVFEPMKDILGEKYNFDHVMNIPLIINVPGLEINETISEIGSQLDFYPTIINILGIENEKGFMMGMDLVNSEDYNYVAPQRILRRGSFIDKNIIFNISRDGIFENSLAIDRKTRAEVDKEKYRGIYDQIIEKINLSDAILKNDLFKYLLDEDEDIDNIKLDKAQKIKTQKRIKTLREFEIEDLDSEYGIRSKIIRVHIDRDTDLDLLEAWMKENEDAYLILKSKENDIELLEKIKNEYKQLKGRYIAEIDDFNDYFLIQRKGFRNIIIDVRGKDYREEQIMDYLELHHHFGIIVEKDEIRKDFAEKLKNMGIRVYIERRNTLKEYR